MNLKKNLLSNQNMGLKLILELNNKTKEKFSKKILSNVFKDTIISAEMPCLEEKTIELSVAMVAEDEMQELNCRYRRKKIPTDVLSFGEYEKKQQICREKKSEIFLGELVLCPEYIARNAREDKETFEYAMQYIVSHGILHLLGFGHGKKMFSLQREVADNQQKKSK